MTIIANGKCCKLCIEVYYTFNLQIHVIQFCLNYEPCNENALTGTCCFSHSDWLQEHAALVWLVIGTFWFIMIGYSNILHSDWLQKHAASFSLVTVEFSFILIGYMKNMLFLSDGFKGTFCFILNGYMKILLHSDWFQEHAPSFQLVTETFCFPSDWLQSHAVLFCLVTEHSPSSWLVIWGTCCFIYGLQGHSDSYWRVKY